MSKQKRNTHSPELKAKVALEVRAPALSAAARVLAPALLGTSCVDPVARWQAVPEGCTRLAQGRWQGANAGGSSYFG